MLPALAAAAVIVTTVSGCNGNDAFDAELDAVLSATIDEGAARYAVTVQQGDAPTIGQVALDATGPTVWGETDFDSGRRHLHFDDIENPSVVVDGNEIFARPGHDPSGWGAAVVDGETLAALDLGQLIALHDPGALLRALADHERHGADQGSNDAGADDAVDSSNPGHHIGWDIPVDRLDDAVTAGLATRLGLGAVEIHAWSSEGESNIRRIAMPLRLGDRRVEESPHGPVPPIDRDLTDEPPGPPTPDDHTADDAPDGALRPEETTRATPESWLVVDLLELGEQAAPDIIESLDEVGSLRPEDVTARLTFEPFTGLADLSDLPDTLIDSPVPGDFDE